MSKAVEINLEKEGIWINGNFAHQLSKEFLESAIGAPRIIEREGKKDLTLMWDDSGIVAYTEDDRENINSLYLHYPSLSDEKKHWDTPNEDFSGTLLFGKKPFKEEIPFKKLAEVYRSIENVKFGNWKFETTISKGLSEKLNAFDFGYQAENPNEIANLVMNEPQAFHTISIKYEPKRVPTETGKYAHKIPDGKILTFKSFNFKLMIIQELMYKKGLIEPKFDVYDFAKDYAKRKIDINDEGYEPIREVKKWFETLPVSADLAKHVGELYLDGGNEIYGQIWPFWDGECDYYDVKRLTEEELEQFPNLRTISGTAAFFSKQACRLFESLWIEYKIDQ